MMKYLDPPRDGFIGPHMSEWISSNGIVDLTAGILEKILVCFALMQVTQSDHFNVENSTEVGSNARCTT